MRWTTVVWAQIHGVGVAVCIFCSNGRTQAAGVFQIQWMLMLMDHEMDNGGVGRNRLFFQSL